MSRNWWKLLTKTKSRTFRRRAPSPRPTPRRLSVLSLEERLTPSQMEWTGGGSTNAWNVPANWKDLDHPFLPVHAPATDGTDELLFPQSPGDAGSKTGQTIGFTNPLFAKITYTGSGYTVSSGGSFSLVASGGIDMTATSGTNTISAGITLNGVSTPISVDSGGQLNLNGAVSGAADITKQEGGILSLGGSNTSYPGDVVVAAGTLAVANDNALGNGTGATQVNSGATLRLNNVSVPSTESLTLGGGTLLSPQSDASTWAGNIIVAAASTIQKDVAGGLTLSGVISGGGDLTKTGNGGIVNLTRANTSYTGDITVAAGTLSVRDGAALGSTAGTTTVQAGGRLDINASAGAFTVPERLFLCGSGANAGGAGALTVPSGGGAVTLSGNIQLTGDATITAGNAGGISGVDQLTLSGVISGAPKLTFQGGGTITLAGNTANAHSGTTTSSVRTLNLNKSTAGPFGIPIGVVAVPGDLVVDGANASVVLNRSGQIASAADVTVNFGLLDLNGNTNTVHSLTMDGGTVHTGSGTLTLGGNVTGDGSISGKLALGSATRTFTVGTGSALTVLAIVSGADGVNLIKEGPGSLALNGANTAYLGNTIVNGGTLVVSNANALGDPGHFTSGGSTSVPESFIVGGTIVHAAGRVLLNGNITVSDILGLDGGTLSGNPGTNTWDNNIFLSATSTVQTGNNATLVLDHLSGSGGLTKEGSGTVTFTGSFNEYDGPTTVNAGTLRLATTNGPAIPRLAQPLTIGQASGNTAVTVIYESDNQIGDNTDVTILRTGVLNLNNHNQFFGPALLTMDGGAVLQTGAGTMTFGNINTGIVVNASDLPATISGRLQLPQLNSGATLPITVSDGPAGSDLIVSAAISGASAAVMNKQGPGNLVLNGASDYAGPTQVNAGTLTAGSSTALGTGNAGTTVALGATLVVTASNSEPITLNGTGVASGGALQDKQAAPVTLSGPINLAGNTTISVLSSGTLTLGGPISGLGSLTKVNGGTLVLTEPVTDDSSNNYTGATTVSGGVLRITTPTALGATSVGTTVQSGAALEIPGGLTVIEPLTLNGAGIGNAGALRAINPNTSGNATWAGPITLASDATVGSNLGKLTLSNAIGGFGGLRTAGNFSTVVLSGAVANNYSGTTVVAGGLHLGKNSGVTAVPGNLQISAGAPGGFVQVLNAEQIANSASVSIGSGAELRLDAPETVGPLTMTGGAVSAFGAGKLILNDDVAVTGAASISKVDLGNAPRRFTVSPANSRLTLGAAEGAAAATLTKDGPGALFLPTNFAGTYTGATIVDNGSMYLFSVTAPLASPTITVNSTGTLAGTGTVNAVNVVGGTLRPGDVLDFATGSPQPTVGTLTVNGDLTLDANATLFVDLNGTVPGSSHDQVRVTGANRTVTLGGALLTGTAGTALQLNDPFVIISNESAGTTVPPLSTDVNGVRDPVQPGEAQNFTIGGQQFSVNYAAGSSNDVRLIKENTSSAFQNRTITPVVDEGGVVTVSGTIVEPDPGDKFTLEVNWGDGSKVEVFTFPAGSHGRQVSVTHRYRDDGAYAVQLFWHDQHGAGNRATLTTTVRNVAPVVSIGGDETVSRGGVLNRIGSFADPGADKWTVTVDYGDGSRPENLEFDDKHRFHLHHKYDRPGTYRVVVTVTDGDGGVGTSAFVVTVRKPWWHW